MKRNDPLLYVHPVLLLNSLNLICINKTTSVCVCVFSWKYKKGWAYSYVRYTRNYRKLCRVEWAPYLRGIV